MVGYNYLVAVDRFSGWAEVFRAIVGTSSSGSQGLIAALRELFGRFGVPLEISSDGASEYTSDETKKFFQRWGVKHQPSSAYHPSSNGRAELGVKSMKRLLMDNVGPSGSLNTDQVLRALITHRNTPDALSRKSPILDTNFEMPSQYSRVNRMCSKTTRCCRCGVRDGQ